MGIPAYFSFIIKNYSSIFKELQHNYDHFLLDSNSIIYDSINESKNDNEIIDNVNKKLHYLINLIKPTKTTIITFDGVAPMAKIKQQRERRYKSHFEKILLNKSDNWNRANITPGTNFMDSLTKKVTLYFKKHKFSCNVIVSGSNVKGEGEHKLCHEIRKKQWLKDTVVIYGLDADLIMLGLIHCKWCSKLFLFRENPDFLEQLNYKLSNNKLYVLDIDLFRIIILKKLSINNKINKFRLYDYILLCFMLGNDFLPHFPAINLRKDGMNMLIDAYKEVIVPLNKTIIFKNKIQWNLFKLLINHLAKQESISINKHIQQNNKKRCKKTLNNLPQIDTTKENIINPSIKGWEKRYYQELFYLEPDSSNLNSITTNYLEGLEWTFKYYTKGCVNWQWYYKFNYPPLLIDLEKAIPKSQHEFILENFNSITPNCQLALVLPKDYYHLIKCNKKIKQKLNNLDTPLYDFDWAFCKYFWESHLNISNIFMSNILNIFN